MADFFIAHQELFVTLTLGTFVFALVAIIMAITTLVRTQKILTTTKVLFRGKKGIDLENVILRHDKQLATFDEEIQELFNIANAINNHARKSLHKIGLVRFNPFGERAGNQSFALALLNSRGDGVVLSSLHTREGTRIYSKQIIKGQVINNELTHEEQEAIANAR